MEKGSIGRSNLRNERSLLVQHVVDSLRKVCGQKSAGKSGQGAAGAANHPWIFLLGLTVFTLSSHSQSFRDFYELNCWKRLFIDQSDDDKYLLSFQICSLASVKFIIACKEWWLPGSDRDEKVDLSMYWFCLNNIPRTAAVSFSHACIENRSFLAHHGSTRRRAPFRFGKIRAWKKSLFLFKRLFLWDFTFDFDNSFSPSSVHVRGTGHTSMKYIVNIIGGLEMISWVYRFLWNTR